MINVVKSNYSKILTITFLPKQKVSFENVYDNVPITYIHLGTIDCANKINTTLYIFKSLLYTTNEYLTKNNVNKKKKHG